MYDVDHCCWHGVSNGKETHQNPRRTQTTPKETQDGPKTTQNKAEKASRGFGTSSKNKGP